MNTRVPPYPSGDLLTWANQLVEYLQQRDGVGSEILPAPVLLQHKLDDERAFTNGLLMYDPNQEKVIYSTGGQWLTFSTTSDLNYSVTDDAGNGTVSDDINNTDFTGQQGAVGTCAECPPSTSTSFYHKGVQYLYSGPTPALYGIGCADTMQDSYLTATGVGTFTALLDTPTTYLGEADKWPRVAGTEDQLVFDVIQEADVTNLDRVRARGQWLSQTYPKNDMVIDSGAGTYWTMIANKSTTDRAAPQEAGDPQYSAPDIPSFSTQQHIGYVQSGMEYTLTDTVVLIGYQIWVPAGGPTIKYIIEKFVYSEPDKSDITFSGVPDVVPIVGAWTTVEVSRELLFAGTTFGIRISALNAAADAQVGPFDWGRDADSNNVGPTTGNWNRNNSDTLLRINKTDNDSQDRSADLLGVIAGSTVTIANKADATQSVTYTTTTGETDQGVYYDWGVQLAGTGVGGIPPVGSITTITITVPVAQATEYVELVGGATTFGGTGFLDLDGVPQAGSENNLYGVRALYDIVTASPDWDIYSWVGSGGGGGGGGDGGSVSEFLDLTDTPTTYAGSETYAVRVRSDGTGLEFVEGSPADFVLKAGDTMTGSLSIQSSSPALDLYDTDGTEVDNRRTSIRQQNKSVIFETINDAGASVRTLMVLNDGSLAYYKDDGSIAAQVLDSGVVQAFGTILTTGGDVQIRNDSNVNLSFRKEAGTLSASLYYNRVSDTLDVNYYDEGGTNARVAGRLPDRIANGGALDQNFSIVTREHGDARYAFNLTLTEFHDPTGVASWKIVGTTLECWGTVAGGSQKVTVTLPKTYARADYAISVLPKNSEGDVGSDTITTTSFEAWAQDAAVDRFWRTIGEWDGIS